MFGDGVIYDSQKIPNLPEQLNNDISPSTKLTKIKCWSSCSFASNCWSKVDPNSYIYCFWNVSSMNRYHTFDASIQDSRSTDLHCSLKVICANVSSDFQESICHTYVFANATACEFIVKSNVNLRITAKRFDESDNEISSALLAFNPCHTVKIDPPGIQKIENSSENIIVTLNHSACIGSSWGWIVSYNLTYTTSDGLRKAPEKIAPFPGNGMSAYLPLTEATLYNISALAYVSEVPKILQMWGDPVEKSFITKPNTATDNDFVGLHCIQKNNEMCVIAKWQKTGIIRSFIVSVKPNKDANKTSVRKEIGKIENGQVSFRTEFCHLDISISYEISLMAINTQGNSKPHTIKFNRTTCDSKRKKPTECRLISCGTDCLTLSWTLPVDKQAFSDFAVITTSPSGFYRNERLNSQSTSYTARDLQVCTLYTLVIQSLYHDIEVGSCATQAYTEKIVPQSSPDFSINASSDTSISLEIHAMLLNQSCELITSYETRYLSNHDTSAHTHVAQTKFVYVTGLLPYTKYTVSVSAITEVGQGPYSLPKEAMTKQAAPSTPKLCPVTKIGGSYLLRWEKPQTPNGEISNYTIKIFNPVKNISLTDNNCDVKKEKGIQCHFNSTVFSTIVILPFETEIYIRACTDHGLKCSRWSEKPLTISEPYPIVTTILLSVMGLVVIIIVFLFIYVHIFKSKLSKNIEPMIHPDILKSLERLPTNDYCDETGTELVALCTNGTVSFNKNVTEKFDSVNDWIYSKQIDQDMYKQDPDQVNFQVPNGMDHNYCGDDADRNHCGDDGGAASTYISEDLTSNTQGRMANENNSLYLLESDVAHLSQLMRTTDI